VVFGGSLDSTCEEDLVLWGHVLWALLGEKGDIVKQKKYARLLRKAWRHSAKAEKRLVQIQAEPEMYLAEDLRKAVVSRAGMNGISLH